MQEEWEKLETRIKLAVEGAEKEREGRREERRGWWDKECKERKREVRKLLREWKKGRGQEHEYKIRRREYRELFEKKKEENEKWVRRAAEVRTEGQAWEIINRERKSKKKVNEGIEMDVWREYFMELLGGVEGRVLRGLKKGRKRDEEEDLKGGGR